MPPDFWEVHMSSSYIVRYGASRFLGEFEAGDETLYARGARVVVRTDRGHEVGDVLCDANPETAQLVAELTRGKIIRKLTGEDQTTMESLGKAESHEFEVCRKLIEQHNLPMGLVDVEHLFGGERIIFYFLAEDRVDFRNLVKDLAREFQTRIELRQIGVRDEAKLLADYGDCGKPVCCSTHMVTLCAGVHAHGQAPGNRHSIHRKYRGVAAG